MCFVAVIALIREISMNLWLLLNRAERGSIQHPVVLVAWPAGVSMDTQWLGGRDMKEESRLIVFHNISF